MSLQTVLLAMLVLLYGAVQYALMAQALRDLSRRARVRGDNKVVWAIVILTLPVAGALLYSWMGPTSLLRRGNHPLRQPPQRDQPVKANVTPIRAARSARTHVQSAPGAASRRGPQRLPYDPTRSAGHRPESDAPRAPRSPRTGS